MKCSISVILSVFFLGILSTFADACVLNGPRYQLASDTVRWSLKLNGGETCIRGVRFNNVVLDKLAVVSAPQTGHVTLQGPGFSYKAATDFQGSDFFSLTVSGATNKVPGSSTIEVEVSVIRADELRRFPTMISPSSQSQPSPPSPAGSPTSSPPLPPPVNDLCGSSNDVAATSAPTTNLCSTGTASVVSGNGPWHWLCTSSNGRAAAQCSAPLHVSILAEVPGPNATLFANPPYTCRMNYYVSTTGNSSNSGTQGSPWDIVTAFNSKTFTAGTCVNIADGTYAPSATLDITTSAGNAATPTGYVVYRAYQTMNGPHIEGTNISNVITVDTNAKYIWIDGLNIDGQVSSVRSTQNCIRATGNNTGNLGDGRSSHHVYVTNSIIQGCGQAGYQGGNTDYLFLLNNTVYNNAWNPAFVLASGISIYEPLALQSYSGTNCSSNSGDCATTKALAYDNFWCASGAANTALNVCYSIVVAWNFIYDNYNPQSGSSNTDGEGYESDDWRHAQNSCSGLTPGCPFNHNGLVMGNAFYGNGGAGWEINGNCGPTTTPSCSPAGVVLVINNTAAYNAWDQHNGGAGAYGEFEAFGDMVNVVFINNTAISHNYNHTAAGCSTCNSGFVVDQNNGGCTGTCANTGSAFQNNITNNISFANTGLTFPTTGGNKNLNGSDPLYVNATVMTPGGPPTLGNDDLRLCQSNGNPGGCTGTSPAISFGQGSFSVWQQTTASGGVDAGTCVVNSPGPAATCPNKGDSLP